MSEESIRERVAKLEAAVKFLLEGAKRVKKEVESEWGEETFGDAEHLGVEV